jgi:hypothetical protein
LSPEERAKKEAEALKTLGLDLDLAIPLANEDKVGEEAEGDELEEAHEEGARGADNISLLLFLTRFFFF